MPSEGSTVMDAALAAVAEQREAFHSALIVTIEQLRGQLDAGAPAEQSLGERAAVRLGRFAEGDGHAGSAGGTGR